MDQDQDRLPNFHPGDVLLEDFLKPMEISAYRLAKDIGVPQTRISRILRGNLAVTPDTAMRLSRYFGTSAEYWMNMQSHHDLEAIRRADETKYSSINPLPSIGDLIAV